MREGNMAVMRSGSRLSNAWRELSIVGSASLSFILQQETDCYHHSLVVNLFTIFRMPVNMPRHPNTAMDQMFASSVCCCNRSQTDG